MPRGNCAQSIASNGSQREDKKLLQPSQLRQHGEFRHVSVSERQRSWPCGQDFCGPFVRAMQATEIEESAWAMAADGMTKALVSPPPRWVSPQLYCGVVRISVDLSCVLWGLISYAAQFFPYQECWHLKGFQAIQLYWDVSIIWSWRTLYCWWL